MEEYIRKLSSLPTTKYIAIREVNTRCPRNDITWGSGPYHNLHQMQRLWIPRLRRLHVTKKVNHGVLDVKGFRLQPFKTHHQEICQLNTPPVQFLSISCVFGQCQSNFKQGQFQERNQKSLHPAVCRGVYQEFQAIHSKKGEAPKDVLW